MRLKIGMTLKSIGYDVSVISSSPNASGCWESVRCWMWIVCHKLSTHLEEVLHLPEVAPLSIMQQPQFEIPLCKAELVHWLPVIEGPFDGIKVQFPPGLDRCDKFTWLFWGFKV